MTTEVQVTAMRPLNKADARALTARIKGASEQLWELLLEVYDRQAWRALGYKSWNAYIKAEFNMSRVHAYRLLDQGRVTRALENAGVTHGLHQDMANISERQARDVKPVLDEVTADVRQRVDNGARPADAIRDAVEQARSQSAVIEQRKRVAERLQRGDSTATIRSELGVSEGFISAVRQRLARGVSVEEWQHPRTESSSGAPAAVPAEVMRRALVGLKALSDTTATLNFDYVSQDEVHEWLEELRVVVNGLRALRARLIREYGIEDVPLEHGRTQGRPAGT